MTEADLELMAARTGSDRLRRVTADDWPDAAERDFAREWVRAMAAEPAWPPPCDECTQAADPEGPKRLPLAVTLHAQKYGFRRCWFSYKDDACGCSGLQCHLLKRRVALRDCAACLARW